MNKLGIFILTQNNIERKIYLKTTLYFLFRNYNKNYKYPVFILHEGDYDDNKEQEEILSSIRKDCKNCINFKKLDKEDFEIPSHIDKNKLGLSVKLHPTPYWRNEKYRLMCRWWLVHFPKYTKDFEYVMRLDDDSIIEEPINQDFIDLMIKNDYIYLSNFIHLDCGLCCYNMKETFEKIFHDKKEKLNEFFLEKRLEENNEIFHKFKILIEEVEGIKYDKNYIDLKMPIMFYNNFFVTKTSFWNRTDVKNIIDIIDKQGNIFYYRYGDAPLQSLIVSLLEKDKVSRIVFKYSKRLQRESFIDNNNFYSYMPDNYNNSSCMSSN